MLKTYQSKTHCKGDSHSSKTANIILPGLMIKQRWTPLRLQAKYSRLRLFNLGDVSTNIMQFNEFKYHFTCSRKDVILCRKDVHLWHQPTGFKFPLRGFGVKNTVYRSFQPPWFQRWPFLHYDESRDVAFCHVCLLAVRHH